MKTAVLDHSGPFMSAVMTFPIQLSPVAIEYALCCEFAALGMTRLRFASVPFFAFWITFWEPTTCVFCPVSMQSANVGQIAQPYGMVVPPPVLVSKIRQLRPAFFISSMIVGSHDT